jgi:hypothetical protein
VPEKKEVVAGLRGKAGVAADRQRKSFEEGGAARRSGSAGGRRQRWPAVRPVVDAGAEKVPSSAGGYYSSSSLAGGIVSVFLSLLTFFSTSVPTATVGKSPEDTVTSKLALPL